MAAVERIAVAAVVVVVADSVSRLLLLDLRMRLSMVSSLVVVGIVVVVAIVAAVALVVVDL